MQSLANRKRAAEAVLRAKTERVVVCRMQRNLELVHPAAGETNHGFFMGPFHDIRALTVFVFYI